MSSGVDTHISTRDFKKPGAWPHMPGLKICVVLDETVKLTKSSISIYFYHEFIETSNFHIVAIYSMEV